MFTPKKSLVSLIFSTTILALSSSPVFAGPHGAPGGHFAPPAAPMHHGAPPPTHHPAPPRMHRPAPPPHFVRHHHDYGWVIGPLAAGALIYGLSEMTNAPSRTIVQSEGLPPPAPTSSVTTTTTTTTKTTQTLYWCEAEQGWWPTVRACPTGWKAMPAPP